MHGASDNLFDSYLQEYMWKKQHKDNIFGNILYWISQTCHSMEMKNLDLTNKKSGFGGKNRDHGQIGYKKK